MTLTGLLMEGLSLIDASSHSPKHTGLDVALALITLPGELLPKDGAVIRQETGHPEAERGVGHHLSMFCASSLDSFWLRPNSSTANPTPFRAVSQLSILSARCQIRAEPEHFTFESRAVCQKRRVRMINSILVFSCVWWEFVQTNAREPTENAVLSIREGAPQPTLQLVQSQTAGLIASRRIQFLGTYSCLRR